MFDLVVCAELGCPHMSVSRANAVYNRGEGIASGSFVSSMAPLEGFLES
jgi:hypothetical protein